MDFLKSFDIYSIPIEFTYREKRNFSTTCGSYCSILILLILGSYTYFLFASLEKALPLINITPYVEDYAPAISLFPYNTNISTITPNTSAIFSFSFGFRSGTDLIQLDPTVFTVNINFVERPKGQDSSTKKTKIDYVYLDSFPPINKTRFDSTGLKNTFSPLVNHTVEGTYGDPDSKYIQVDILRCSNKTSAIPCKSKEFIDNQMGSLTLEMFMVRQKFNLTNRANTIYSFLDQYHYILLNDTRKVVEFKFSIMQMQSHDSLFPKFLYDPFVSWYILHVSDPDESIRSFVEKDNIIATFYFYSDKEHSIMTRTSISYLDRLYIVGGLEKFFVACGMIAIFFYVRHRFEEAMANDFFNIIDPKKEEFIMKDYAVYLKHRYFKFIEMDRLNLSQKNQREFCQDEECLDQFFNRERISTILGLKSFKSFVKVNGEEKSELSQKTPEGEEKVLKKNVDESNRSNAELNNEKTKIFEGAEKDNLKDLLPDPANINLYEYYKNKIIYDIFKYECYDKMFFSVREVFVNKCFPCCANKNTKKRFQIFELAKKKMMIDIDFQSLIKGVNETDKLKEIFFDKEQKLLFDSFASKSISHSKIEEEEEAKEQNFFLSRSKTKTKENEIAQNLDNEGKYTIELLNSFEEVLDNVKMRGLSAVDRLLLEYMGIDPDVITNFALGVGRGKMKEAKDVSKQNNNQIKRNEENLVLINKLLENFNKKSKMLTNEEIEEQVNEEK